jgi:CRP/FNR family transcriptional regulator, cyclic AMP receptor protein
MSATSSFKPELLRSFPLFSSLTDDELLQIRGRVTMKEFAAGEVILREEATNFFMYIILSGKVKVTQLTDDGKEIILALHGSADFFGEISLIDGKTSPASVVATEDSLIALISRDNFRFLLANHPKVLDAMLESLCMRLRQAWAGIHLLNKRDAAERLKMLFRGLAHRHGHETSEGTVVNVRLTHQEIANMAGLTRESVTRVLDRWKGDGEIAVLADRRIRLSPAFFRAV